jgi:hypothetical protein
VYHSFNITYEHEISSQGWNDLQGAAPLDPRSILATAQLGVTVSVFKRSTTFLQSTWGTNPAAFTGNNTTLISLDNTDAKTQIAAIQWAFKTKMVNVGAAVNSTMSKVGFARAGLMWDNAFEIGFGGIGYTDVQFSCRDNLGTLGQFAGSASGAVPVFSFPGTITGNVILHLTFLSPGTYSMVMVMSNAGTYSATEFEFVVL